MVKQKVKYILSAVLMFCIAFAFIFSTVFKITNRDVSKALAIDVSSVQEFKDALTNGTDSEIVITQDMEIPCEQIDESAGAGNIQTAEIIINRSATIKSGGDGIKTIKRTGKDGAKNNLRSLFEVAGNGVEVTFEDVVLDGGASLPVTSGRIYYTGDETVKGRSLIDVCQGSTLNVGNGCTIQNSFADSSISTHGYSTSLPCCGGAIRTDFYSDNNGIDMRGGTINLLNGSTVKDCSTKAIAADWVTPLENYGGAVAAYDLGTINIYGGSTISSCTSSNGGAIGICHGTSTPYVTGSLNIYGGSFNDCRALKGGAVNVGKNDNESNDPKFKLLAETATTFNECQATGNGSAGNTFYVDEGNKIYLAPYYTKIEGGQEVVVGNVSISSNCFGGEGDGSYDGQLPENLKGYTKHMHFQAYNGDGARENEKVVTEGLVNVKIKIEPVDDSTKYTAIIDGDLSEDDLTYKWYESADGTNWQEVNNQTGKELVVNNTDENKYYKVDVTSGSSGSKASAQTKFLDDAIEELKVTTSKNGENKTTYTANITYKDPETAGESVVGPKYQWYEVTDEGTPVKINGATSKTYTPENDDGSKTYKVVISSDYYKGTKEAQSEPGGVDPSNAVFKVGSGDNWTYFDNLKNAFSSVSSGESIVALKDYTLTEEAVLGTSSVSIDLDGHTITQTDAAKIRIRNTSGTVNISNGTVVGNLDMVADGPQDNDEYIYGAIKLENMTVQGAIYNDGHPLNITSGKYESVVANRFSTNTISGGTFSGNVESYDGANINITSGYFSGNINKSENGGEIKISGGKFVNEPDVNYIKDGFETFDDKGETVDGVYYGYEVLKQRPTESLFSIEGLTQTYDGTGKGVTVTEKNGGHEFDGKITVTYCKELDIGTDAETWTPELPIDVEFYKVKIQIAETENYSATQFTRTFNIAKSTPEAGMFTFNANDVPYDGESKKAQVTFNEKYDSNFPDVVHTGMGEVTVHYYKDSDCKYELFYPDKEVKNAGTYYVGVTVASGKNYFATEEGKVLRKEDWKFSITKLVPTADLFEIKDNEYIYDGQRKAVTVEEKSGKSEFRDKFRVKYYYEKEGVTDWYYDAPTEKGDYRVSIEIKDAENYEDKVVEFDNSSNLKINKATPTVDMFNFSASDATYDGESKEAQVTFNEKYDSNFPDVVHTGMGEVTVHYYKDQGRTDEVSKENVRNAGTYYVGITVADGKNYFATEEGKVLRKEDWKFVINKAKPTLDFTVINGGITGNEPQLKTDDKKEIFYGKTLGDSKDILPKSGIGTWSFKDQGQVMKPVGEQYVDLVFTPKDTENYDWSNVLGYDPSTERLNVKLLVSTVVDKSGWGDKVKVGKEGTVENYVDNDKNSPNKGSTSVEITGDGIHWLKETSFDVDLGHNTTAWYGIDNSSGIFERGSRFLIRWINRAENSNEWDETNKGIDNTEVQNMPDKKKWIFIAEVIHPDGTHKYEKLSQSVPLYVQLGEDWDKDDVKAYFISQSGKDEEVSREPLTMLCPEGEKEFFKLELLHFSPYTIYDVDPVSSNTDESRTVSPGNGEESNSTQKEENYSEAEKSNNSDTDNRNSQNYKESENSDGGKSSTQENTKNGIKSWYIIAGGSLLLLALLLGWWLLYKKRKKEKDVIRKSFFASLASSARK